MIDACYISIDLHFVIRMVLVRMIQLSSAEMHKHLKFGIQVRKQIQENEKAQVQDFFTLKKAARSQLSAKESPPLAELHTIDTKINCNTKDLHNISKLELINDRRDLGVL